MTSVSSAALTAGKARLSGDTVSFRRTSVRFSHTCSRASPHEAHVSRQGGQEVHVSRQEGKEAAWHHECPRRHSHGPPPIHHHQPKPTSSMSHEVAILQALTGSAASQAVKKLEWWSPPRATLIIHSRMLPLQASCSASPSPDPVAAAPSGYTAPGTPPTGGRRRAQSAP